MATVFIPAALRGFSEGRDRVDAAGHTLRQVIDALEAACPGIKERLILEDALHPGIAMVIDNEVASAGLIEKVGETSEVRILPAMEGG